MRQIAIAFIMFSASALAEDPFKCVDPDFKAAVFGFYGQSNYSTLLPPNFPETGVPEEYRVVGSSSSRGNITVAFHSKSGIEEVNDEVARALDEAGWMTIDERSHQFSGGFVARAQQQPTKPSTYCHDAEGAMWVVSKPAISGGTYVNLSNSRNRWQSCEELQAEHMGYGGPSFTLPTLLLPDDVRDAQDMGQGSSGDDIDARAEFVTRFSLSEVSTSFASQLATSGWDKEGEWQGFRSAGSAWLSSDESKMLQVVVARKTGGQIRARMHLQALR